MAGYIPDTAAERRAMLDAVGADSMESLLAPIPAAVRLERPLDLPQGLSEMEVAARISALAARNTVYDGIFRGAGAYCHFIPAAVRQLAAREEFVTAYTPYQAEISQGVLQSIFEYQTMVCELTGMDAANASVYDGAMAALEAARMAAGRDKRTLLVSEGVHPNTLAVLRTGCGPLGIAVETVPLSGGVTDPAQAAGRMNAGTAALLVQNPNFYGCVEDLPALAQAAHASGAFAVASVLPLTLGLLQSPGEAGFDIAVGEGQALGQSLSFGGPYLGLMACRRALIRRLPGRIVGQTKDAQGRRGFVLTLQAREQHIRREKASSSICSNQALNALTAAVYLTVMGPAGLREAAEQSLQKAHFLARGLTALPGVRMAYDAPFFHEFVTCHEEPAENLLARLECRGLLGGLPLPGNRLLWCVTEYNTLDQMERLLEAAGEVAHG